MSLAPVPVQEMESFVKKVLHLHLILLAVAATVVLCVELYKFVAFIVEH
jgi:hypothetical protein